jgi:hypothetical protein
LRNSSLVIVVEEVLRKMLKGGGRERRSKLLLFNNLCVCITSVTTNGICSNVGIILTGESEVREGKPILVPHYPPQIPYGLPWCRTRTPGR